MNIPTIRERLRDLREELKAAHQANDKDLVESLTDNIHDLEADSKLNPRGLEGKCCPICNHSSGDDWSQCPRDKVCPMRQ